MSTHPSDPVNLDPIPPLRDSYVYHSAPYVDPENDSRGWIMGIDEAGRGRPMVYAAAYCPMSFKPSLESIGFDDSKALSDATRQSLWDAFDEHPPLCYSSATLSPQSISAGMLRRVAINLNQQAQCYVDALGPSPQYQAKLSALFPSIAFTVCPKADSLFKIVGAASIIAKVTRDRYIFDGVDPEDFAGPSDLAAKSTGDDAADHSRIERGSGYPSDPRTQAYLKNEIDPVFGYKGVARFSWATVKVLLDKHSEDCKWIDDTAQPSAASWFGADADAGRPKYWRDIGACGVDGPPDDV